ncbi:MAG: tetratricopeptide repeat protein [Schlesneria sp.]
MRRFGWMLVLGWIVGCGGVTTAPSTVQDVPVREITVPAEVAPFFERGELAQAVDALNGMISKQPQNVALYSLRATAHHRMGNNDEALADLDHAISLDSRDARLFNNRGFVRLGMEQFQAANSDFDKATELASKFTNAYNNRGLLYIAQQRFGDAIVQFNRAIEIDPQYIDAYNNRGFAELESGQIEQALDDFNVAIQLNPKYVNAYNNRGLLRAQAGDFENAVIDFTQAMMLDPLNPKYYEHRAEVYLRQGASDKSIADERKIVWLIQLHELGAKIAASTRPVRELTQRARHYLDVNDIENALKDLDRAVSLDSRSAEALSARSNLHLRKKSMHDAKADAVASLAIEPNQEAFSVLGDVFLSLGDYDKAIENFANARRVDPSVAEAYYAKSKALAAKGEVEKANDTLQQALVLDPDVESRLR